MRLTLRTLLAWRDGMLDAAAAASLGERVAASPAAGQLHDRIREVVARQMLTAPPPAGPGLAADANSTAEYLDNVMPGDRIEEFERVCFGSDMQMAEAAGCHEILAELHRNPEAEAAVDRTTVARLLAAARAAEGRTTAAKGPEARGRASQPQGRRRLRRRVGKPRRASAAAWLLAIAAALLLIALLGVFGWSIGRGGSRVAADRRDRGVAPADAARDPGPDPVTSPPAVTAEPDAGVEPLPPEPSRADASASPPPSTVSEATAPPAESAPASPAASDPAVDAAAAPPAAVPATAPVPEPPAAAAVGLSVPHGDALAIAARPAEAATVPEPAVDGAEPPVVAAPAAPPAGAAVVAGTAPLLVRNAAATGWDVAGDAVPIELPAELLAPAAVAPAVVVDGMRVVLRPGARAGLARAADGTPRLELIFGSALVAAARGQRIGVSAGGLHGLLEDLGGPVVIDVALDRPPGTESEEVVTRASIAAAAVTFVPEADAEGHPALAGVGPRCAIAGAALDPPAAAAALRWSSVEPGTARLDTLGESPVWLAGSWPVPESDRAAAAALAARLTPGVDVVAALHGLAADRRGENRAAAVATLALLGDYSPLAEQLCTEDPRRTLYERQWRRLATEAVPLALARGVNAATKLRAALSAAGPPGGGAEVVPLADGFSDEELAAGADARLVAALESPHLVIRRWALANLVAIVRPQPADEARYRADADGEARRAGVAWWRGLLDRGMIRRDPGATPQADRG